MEKSNSLNNIAPLLITNKNFIIFGEDFARHPHALEHLLRPLFLENQFVWVETIGLRSPRFSLYDIKRITAKLATWFLPSKKPSKELDIPANVYIVSPLMIPFNQFSVVRLFNQWMVVRSINKVLKAKKMGDLITIASVPNACDYIGHFEEKLKIYFCVDEFSLWPGLDKKLVENFEKKLIAKSDLIIATSDALAKSKTLAGSPTPVITHGVEFEHFNIGKNLKKNPFYQICYFGLFDERSDQDVLLAISTRVADCQIHIFGNVVCDIKKLKDQKNIIFHGPVNYQQLPQVIMDMDAFILPYVKNELTNFINPLKLKEYLSTGRPVIATDLPEVIKLQSFLFTAKTSDEFVEQIDQLKNNQLMFDSDRVVTYVKNFETWKAKAYLLSSLIKKNT